MNYMNFEFIGELGVPKKGHLTIDKYDAGTSTKLNAFVKKDNMCSAFLELSNFKGAKIFPIKMKFKPNKDAEQIEVEIPYEKRNEKETLDISPDYKKMILDLEDDFELKEEAKKLYYEIKNAKWNNEITEEIEAKIKEYEEKNF